MVWSGEGKSLSIPAAQMSQELLLGRVRVSLERLLPAAVAFDTQAHVSLPPFFGQIRSASRSVSQFSMSASRGYEVFVHGIPWTVSKKEITKYCSQFGKVISSHVAFNKETGMHNGFGFVNFRTKDAVNNLNNQNIHFVEGAIIRFDPRSRQERLGLDRQARAVREQS